MTEFNIPRIVIAASHSGAGKTTIVTGLLANMKRSGLQVQSYKVGPDYIDPGYHQLASGKQAHNLDTWLLPAEQLVNIFAKTAQANDIAIIEGVMGLYDGGREGVSSTAAIAKMLKAPVVLVIDAKSMGESAAAVVLGCKLYDPDVDLAGVIVNRIGSDTHRKIVCDAIGKLGIPVLGCISRNAKLVMPERHLGLTPVTEHDTEHFITEVAEHIGCQVDISQILKLAQTAQSLLEPVSHSILKKTIDVRIGVARDEAFSFYYPESLDVLAALGAELVPFSPLSDHCLPDVHGVILGGGFPEMFVDQLSENISMRQAILQAGRQGMPVYAECGGLMYLTREIMDFTGQSYNMVGLVPARCEMCSKLQTVGYVEATAVKDNILCNAGNGIRGHEFHFSQMIVDQESNFPWAFQFKKARTGLAYPGGYADQNILASYLHLHFAGNIQAAQTFIDKCREFKTKISPCRG